MEIRIPQNAPVIPHKRHWQFCVGSGHALLALRTDYVKQLKFIHDRKIAFFHLPKMRRTARRNHIKVKCG